MPSPSFAFSFSFSPAVLPRAFALALALTAAACTPKIGDSCVLSTDCSSQGNRQCDTSMPGGYCTIYNCGPNGCPDYAACYLFHPAVQGCDYNDRSASRTGKSFCMAGCKSNSDCRAGYNCEDPRLPPWNADLLDDNQDQKVCVPGTDNAFTAAYGDDGGTDGEAPVCLAYPDVDAAFPTFPDAGTPLGTVDATVSVVLDAAQ
jgi:hypothetical protein